MLERSPARPRSAPQGGSGQGVAARLPMVCRSMRSARQLRVTNDSVRAWRRRFEREGVDGVGGSRRAGVGLVAARRDGRRRGGQRHAARDPSRRRVDALVDPARWPSDIGSARTPSLASGATQSAAVEGRHLQAVERPALRGEAGRRRRALSEPAGAGGRVQLRREDPGPGARSHPAVPPDEARAGRDHDP